MFYKHTWELESSCSRLKWLLRIVCQPFRSQARAFWYIFWDRRSKGPQLARAPIAYPRSHPEQVTQKTFENNRHTGTPKQTSRCSNFRYLKLLRTREICPKMRCLLHNPWTCKAATKVSNNGYEANFFRNYLRTKIKLESLRYSYVGARAHVNAPKVPWLQCEPRQSSHLTGQPRRRHLVKTIERFLRQFGERKQQKDILAHVVFLARISASRSKKLGAIPTRD